MDDDILSLTGRPVPRIGIPDAEQHWLWNAVGAAICPLAFIPRHIYRGDWIAVAMWTIVLAAGCVRSHQLVKPQVTPRRLVMFAVFLIAAVLVFVIKNPTFRVAGLIVAVIAFLIEFAVAERTVPVV